MSFLNQGRTIISALALILSALTARKDAHDSGNQFLEAPWYLVQSHASCRAQESHCLGEAGEQLANWALAWAVGQLQATLRQNCLYLMRGPPDRSAEFALRGPNFTIPAHKGSTRKPVGFVDTAAVPRNCVWAIAGPRQNKRRLRHPHRQL